MNEKEKIKYVVAFTYGDGYIGRHGINCRFEANNIIDNKDYIEWRASILQNITETKIYFIEINRGNRKNILKTSTKTHPIFTKVHSRMYLNGKKVIDPHYLKLLDWETLAIWYMDDGSIRPTIRYYKDKTYYCTPTPNLATCCFSYGDNLLIKKAIKENLEIEFNISKHAKTKLGEQQYILNLASSSFNKFVDGVRKYILPSFEYKLNPYEKPLLEREGGEKVRTTEKSVELDRNVLA
jgi:hypothetical protein